MTLLAIALTANANMSADGFVRFVRRADLEAMTGNRLAAVLHAKVPMAPLEIKPAPADVGVGQSICIRFTTPSPARLHDAHRDTTGSSAAALQWLRVFDEEKACCSPAGRSCIASTRATLWRGHALVVGEHDLHFTGAML